MAGNNQDVLARVYAALSSLRKNIGEIPSNNIPEKYVNEFHTALNKIQAIGIDIAEFRITDSEIAPIVTEASAVSSITGYPTTPTRYSKEKYVDKLFILTKLDSILGYFEIITSEKPRRIGFNP